MHEKPDDLPPMDIDAAMYFYEQANKELSYILSCLRAAQDQLDAAEEGLSYANEWFEEDRDRFLLEAPAWAHRIHEHAETFLIILDHVAEAMRGEERAARILCELMQPPADEEEKN